jgi:hypothetical protein
VPFIASATTVPSASQDRTGNHDAQNQIVGAWWLAWLQEEGADGKVHRADRIGLLVYTRMATCQCRSCIGTHTKLAALRQHNTQQGGYEASYGKYEINDAHTFRFHVEGALVRSLIGKDLKREYEFSGKQLIVKSSDPNEHWRVAGEHY